MKRSTSVPGFSILSARRASGPRGESTTSKTHAKPPSATKRTTRKRPTGPLLAGPSSALDARAAPRADQRALSTSAEGIQTGGCQRSGRAPFAPGFDFASDALTAAVPEAAGARPSPRAGSGGSDAPNQPESQSPA